MQQQEYEKALIVAASWRLALNNDINELVAIMCVLRNWTVQRYGAPVYPDLSGRTSFRTYSEVVENFLAMYPTRPLPAINEGALVDPVEGLLMKVDAIYNFSLVDLTSSRAFPFGARYFGRAANPSPWFKEVVLQRQDIHPLIGNFGSQSFYV